MSKTNKYLFRRCEAIRPEGFVAFFVFVLNEIYDR